MPDVIDNPPKTEPKAPPDKADRQDRPTPEIPGNSREGENASPRQQGTRGDGGAERGDRGGRIAKVPLYKRPGVLLIAAIVLLLIIIFGGREYLYARSHESTDDAFIDGHIVEISPRVAGHVTKVYVNDNQEVKEGDLLAELDPRDFQARLDQAKGQLAAAEGRESAATANVALTRKTSSAGIQQASSGVTAAQSGVQNAEAQVRAAQERAAQARAAITTAEANARQAQAQIKAAQAEANRTAADVTRYQELYSKDEVSKQQLDAAIAAAQSAAAQLTAAQDRATAAETQVSEARAAAATAEANVAQMQAQVKEARANVGQAQGKLAEASAAPQQVAVSQAQAGTASGDIEQIRAQVQQAELELSYTKIYAPSAGRVTKKTVQEGAYVQVGQPLLALVPSDLWVTANFKETQLDYIRPGQPVEVEVDAFPGKTFKGHVDSIQRGSGARFSLLPPENASGNYVKVVQRVPVKIVFDEPPDPHYPLGPGMSVTPEVKVK